MHASMDTALLIVNAAVGIAILAFLLVRRTADSGAGAGASASAEALAKVCGSRPKAGAWAAIQSRRARSRG